MITWVLPNMSRIVDVVVDLETCGVKPGSAIRSIGAIAALCDVPIHGEIGKFSANIDWEKSLNDWGFTIDPDTMAWWRNQPAVKRDLDKLQGASVVMTNFGLWYSNLSDLIASDDEVTAFIWGYGSIFDIAILEAAFRLTLTPIPWTYKDVRCLRTFAALLPEHTLGRPQPEGEKHIALKDAHREYEHLAVLQYALDNMRKDHRIMSAVRCSQVSTYGRQMEGSMRDVSSALQGTTKAQPFNTCAIYREADELIDIQLKEVGNLLPREVITKATENRELVVFSADDRIARVMLRSTNRLPDNLRNCNNFKVSAWLYEKFKEVPGIDIFKDVDFYVDL